MPSKIQIHSIFLFLCISGLLFLFFKFLSPFITTLFIAAICTSVLYPSYKFLRKKSWNRIISAMTVFIAFIAIVVVPVILLANKLYDETTNVSTMLINYAQGSSDSPIQNLINHPFIKENFPKIAQIFTIENIATKFGETISQISSTLFSTLTNVIKNITFFVLQLIMFLFALFFFLMDGSRITKYIYRLLPLSKNQKNELFKRIYDLMRSMLFGIIVAGITQGIFLVIGFSIVGIPNALFWAMIGVVFSPIPYVGSAIIWVPITIFLFLNDQWVAGTFLIIWCAGIVANLDNLIKSYLIGSKSNLHPFAVLLMLLGGVLSYGFQGLVFAPLVLMLLLSFLHIYKLEYKEI